MSSHPGALDHESEGERTLAVLFAHYDPPLEAQVWITPRIRADFGWRDVTMILEYDGEQFTVRRTTARTTAGATTS
ncbi:MAG: hypothetical protein ACRDYX_07485 [Egibacteraceae bacterium]